MLQNRFLYLIFTNYSLHYLQSPLQYQIIINRMSSLKRLSNPATHSHSSLFSSFCLSPSSSHPLKKYRYTNPKQPLSRNTSKPHTPKPSRPVSRKNSLQKSPKPSLKPSNPSKPLRKTHKPIQTSTPLFHIPFYNIPQPPTPPHLTPPPSTTPLTRSDFSFKSKIGSGGFGQVWKVEFHKNKRLYALKQISKIKVIIKKSISSILNQKEILLSLYNPFIINMKCSFQDKEKLYLVVDYLSGGDLRYRLFHQKTFSEEDAKFLVACIVMSLEYLRQNNIIHRDLKPENLVFEGSGYLRLTDFGVSRLRKDNNSTQTSGTPGYMSPEVILKQNHSFEADYFALGIITYELMLRKRPYNGTRKQIRDQILSKEAKVKRQELPLNWSDTSIDFINRLITRKKEARLGYAGIEEIKRHPWLQTIDWNKLRGKEVKVPFKGKAVGETVEYLREVEMTGTEGEGQLEYQEQRLLLRNRQIQGLFEGYEEEGAFRMYQGRGEEKSTFCTRDD